MDGTMLDLSADELLTTTRAVRRRLDLERPVQRSVIEKCLEIGFQAPNGQNMQAWAWVAVDDPATRAQMADIYRAGVMAFHAEIEEAAKEGPRGPAGTDGGTYH
jgi:nitroreductase